MNPRPENNPMQAPPCPEFEELLVLHAYGELSFDQEESVDTHAAGCQACQTRLEELKTLHAALDDAAAEPPFDLLADCRRELRREVAAIAEAAPASRGWRRWLPAMPSPWVWQPVAALSLLAVGFLGARLTPPGAMPFPGARPEAAPLARTVRYIEPGQDGKVRIVFDEVSRRELAGRLDERQVRELLVSAASSQGDPALRVDSVEYLSRRGEREEIRKTLVRALEADPNEGVRLKALEALRPYASQADVRQSLSKVLLADQSATVRTQAIDLLVSAGHDQSELAGVLQELMLRESNSYIRQRGQSALRAMNASLETF